MIKINYNYKQNNKIKINKYFNKNKTKLYNINNNKIKILQSNYRKK